jgi:hypothetical protein
MTQRTIETYVRSIPRYVLVALAETYVLSLLSLGIGLLVARAVWLLSGASGVSAAILFVGVALVAAAVALMFARRFIPASFLTVRSKASNEAVRNEQEEETERWIRAAARTIAAEIADNHKLVRESPDGKWGNGSPLLLSEAWYDRAETIARAEGGQWAFKAAMGAYHEFYRLNQSVKESWPRYDADLTAVVNAAQTAEAALAAEAMLAP